ncbi:hypothetical protein PC110_g95 [Phytophthora cactorum]|uniref:GAF domain-like n=2 Tax=Phytophthora cactorum TaxID=29920 RepID=A0A329T4I3_9STRA|nr:hypothetical protein PC110_g95 [Phytophthora cactorum]
MPGEKRHVAALAGEKEALGANWKSAQCVTSLYDSYIQVQKENEQLREDVRRLEQSELLAKIKEPENTKGDVLEQEIRLLRSEKLRVEETHRLELQKLETRAASSETQHQQLVAKYHERFEFDPLEAKRAAMAVKTMQNTLQNVVLEKEEIGIRYGELKEQYRKFHNEQVDIVRNLNQQVKTLEQQRVRNGQQRVVNSLANWSTNKVQNAWNKWIELTKEKRRYEENKQVMATLERKVDDRVAKIRGNQAALLAMKLLQQAARRSFILWRDSTRRNVERRRKGARFAEKRSKRQLQRVIMCWRREFQKEKYYRLGMSKIERLVAFSLRRWGMRKWSVQTFRLVLEEKDRRLSALNGTMELQTKTIVGLEMALDESQNARRELQRRQEEEKMKYAEKIETHQAAALAVRQKLGRFFTKQSDRQLLKDILREWRTMATYLLGVRKRTDLAQAKLRTLKLKRSVNNWHYRALQTHKKRLKTLQILSRMRHLGVLKCFNSWRELVNEQKSRKTALLYAVNRIRNRGIARCFSQWVAFKEQRISLRSGIESMAALAIKQQLFFMFSSWKEQVTTLKIAAQVRQQQLIQQAWENRLEQAKRDLNFQRECFTQWHKLVLQRQRHDIVVKKCLARLKNVFLAKSLGSWREFVENRKNQRDLVRRWVARCNTGALQRAWNRWQRQNVLKEQQLLMLRLQQERDAELKQLETEFELYRTAQQMLREETEQIQTEQKKTLKETRIRLQEETKRAQRFAVAVETLCSNKDRESTQLRCFKAWYAVVRRSDYFRKTVDIFQNTLDVRQTRKILTKWRNFTSQQRRLNAIFTTIQSCLSRWWQIQCFKAWKEARRRSRAVQIFSTLFCRNSEISISREVFTEWRKLARKNHLLRKTLEKIWLGSVHAKMRQQFRHWVEITKAEATKEQIEKRNVALAEIRAKVWWKQSVSTMRFCFSEWKETVETRKKQRLAERKLLLFQRTRLITVCFKNWAELVAIRSKAEERNQQFACWLRKLQRRKQQRAMTLWKILVIRNQQRDLEELKKVRSNQQEELQLQREEIALLMCTAAETKRKLADVTDIHDESTIKMLYLTECGLVAKYFNALKLKIMLKRTVSREVSEAFALWKIKIFDIRRKHRALVSVANVRQRRKRLFAFWLWKVKMLRWRQLDSLRKLWGRSDLLAILQRWRKFSTTQAKLRLFLTKRCLLSYTTRCLPVSIAFRLWKTKAAALHQLATLHTELQSEQDSSTTHLRRLALGKWCWIAYHHRLRQMRAFLSRCYVNSTKTNAVRYRRAIEEMQLTSEAALAKVKEQSEARAHEEMGALSAAEEQLTAGASFQALQTLIRRLFQPTSLKDLFVSVSSTFAQILHGSAAVLFLFDPSSNELWTQREENQLIQVPASLGIAGSTLSSGSTLIVTDVSSDPRFHPMVDQFAMSGLQQDDTLTISRSNLHSKPTYGMVSSALVSTNGAVYGVLQVAFPTSSLSPIDRRILITQTQLYSKICCYYVEQMIFEMLRNCRDRVRARLPEKFIKLFKQNKNWRKYYALIERKATELENKLRDVLEEREQLIQSKSELHKRHQLVKDKLESSQQNTKTVSKLVTDWKKKLVKWQQELDEKDQAIGKKTSELEKVETEFERYRRERRSKDLQNVLNSPTKPPRGEECDESQSLSDHGQLSILRADKTRLKSQLIRAEADNLLLVKAISISRSQHGELPRTIQAEVTRVATRVSRRAPSEA